LHVVKTERAGSTQAGPTANPGTKGKNVKIETVIERALLGSEKRRESGTPDSSRNRMIARERARGPVQRRERRAKEATSCRGSELRKREVSNKNISEKISKRSSKRKGKGVRDEKVEKRRSKRKGMLSSVSKSSDQTSRKTSVPTEAADFRVAHETERAVVDSDELTERNTVRKKARGVGRKRKTKSERNSPGRNVCDPVRREVFLPGLNQVMPAFGKFGKVI